MSGHAPARSIGDLGIVGAALLTAGGGFVDAYLFLRHGVFGFAQTGNVILLAVHATEGLEWTSYLWPILAYLLGLCVAQTLRAGWRRRPRLVIGGTIAAQVAAFAVLAALPASTGASVFVLTLSFIGGIRLEMFRSTGEFSFVSIATTGNLMRFVQAGTAAIQQRSPATLRAAGVMALMVLAFVGGAFAGAAAARVLGSSGLWGVVALELLALIAFLVGTARARQRASDGSLGEL